MGTKLYSDVTGRQWPIWIQEKEKSCAAAASYMAVALSRKRSLAGGEEQFVRAMSKSGSNYTDFLLDEGVGNASMKQIGDMLTAMGVRVSHTHKAPLPVLKRILEKADEQRPVITNVAWPKGAHQVVCVGLRGGVFTFLDPLYGLVTMDPAVFPDYTPNGGLRNARHAAGVLTGWYTQLLS